MIRRLLIIALLLPAPGLLAEMGPIEGLVERSPFLPPGYRAPTPPPPRVTPTPAPVAAANRFELVGVVSQEGEISVSLRPRGKPRGEWLKPGEEIDDVRFVSFNLGSREAVVETGGRRETIPLKAPSVTGQVPQPPPPAASQQPPPPKPPNARPGRGQPEENVRVPVRRRVIVPRQQE